MIGIHFGHMPSSLDLYLAWSKLRKGIVPFEISSGIRESGY